MTFSVLSAADLPGRATRASKTTPLRNALAALQAGEAIEVAYDTHDIDAGYRATTISQVAGTMTANSTTVKFSVRKKADGSGCYIIAGPKPPETDAKRGRKPKTKAEATADAKTEAEVAA